MDTKQLVDKLVNNEITQEQFDQEVDKLTTELTPEQQKETKAILAEELKETAKALAKARVAKKRDSEQNEEEFVNKMRDENLAAAKEQFFKDMGIATPEEITAFEEGFKSESVTVDNIKKDMKRHYAATHDDEYFNLLNEKRKREQEAEEFNANNGGTNGSGGGGTQGTKDDKEVLDFIKQAQQKFGRTYTVEQAKQAISFAKNKGKIE